MRPGQGRASGGPCPPGLLTPLPLFVPQPLVLFPFEAAGSTCHSAEPVAAMVEIKSQIESLCAMAI